MFVKIRVVETAEGLVVEALGDVPPLTDARVRETLERIRSPGRQWFSSLSTLDIRTFVRYSD